MVAPSVKIPEPLAQSIHQYEFAKRLVNQDIELHLVCRRPKNPLPTDDNIIFHKIMSKEFPLKRPVFTLDTYRYLKTILKSHTFDLIHDRGYLFGGAGTRAGNKYKLPVVLQIDDDWVETEALASRFTRTRLYKKSAITWCKKLLSRVDFAFTVSETLKQKVIETWGGDPDNIIVIPNGADTEKFRPNRESLGLRQQLNLGKDAKVVTFVGALGPWHGVQFLIESAPLIIQELPNAHLWIVGGAKEYDSSYLHKLIKTPKVKNQVHFIGSRPPEDIPQILVESDVAVAPYPKRDLGFSPLKIFEYMASGCPIVTSNLPSIREILTNNETALLVEPENVRALTEAILKILQTPKMAKRLSSNAHKKVVESYSWDVVTNKLIELYVQILS